jgi:hypothetical protein
MSSAPYIFAPLSLALVPKPLDTECSSRAAPLISGTLELSQSRTYDSALAILGAYKLTGNFPTELEIVLRDLGVLDRVTFQIEPKRPLSDIRRVVFRAKPDVHADRFREITSLIATRIGFHATRPWWRRLLTLQPSRQPFRETSVGKA